VYGYKLIVSFGYFVCKPRFLCKQRLGFGFLCKKGVGYSFVCALTSVVQDINSRVVWVYLLCIVILKYYFYMQLPFSCLCVKDCKWFGITKEVICALTTPYISKRKNGMAWEKIRVYNNEFLPCHTPSVSAKSCLHWQIWGKEVKATIPMKIQMIYCILKTTVICKPCLLCTVAHHTTFRQHICNLGTVLNAIVLFIVRRFYVLFVYLE